jgi:hypothetical protein
MVKDANNVMRDEREMVLLLDVIPGHRKHICADVKNRDEQKLEKIGKHVLILE